MIDHHCHYNYYNPHHYTATSPHPFVGMFIIDVISVLPFFLLDLSPLVHSGTLLRVPRLLRLAKLAKLFRGGFEAPPDLHPHSH